MSAPTTPSAWLSSLDAEIQGLAAERELIQAAAKSGMLQKVSRIGNTLSFTIDGSLAQAQAIFKPLSVTVDTAQLFQPYPLMRNHLETSPQLVLEAAMPGKVRNLLVHGSSDESLVAEYWALFQNQRVGVSVRYSKNEDNDVTKYRAFRGLYLRLREAPPPPTPKVRIPFSVWRDMSRNFGLSTSDQAVWEGAAYDSACAGTVFSEEAVKGAFSPKLPLSLVRELRTEAHRALLSFQGKDTFSVASWESRMRSQLSKAVARLHHLVTEHGMSEPWQKDALAEALQAMMPPGTNIVVESLSPLPLTLAGDTLLSAKVRTLGPLSVASTVSVKQRYSPTGLPVLRRCAERWLMDSSETAMTTAPISKVRHAEFL